MVGIRGLGARVVVAVPTLRKRQIAWAARAAQCGALGLKIDEELDHVTVYVHEPVSAGGDGDPAQTRYSTDALVDRLNAGEPYAVAFGGQGSAWLETLEEAGVGEPTSRTSW